MNIKKYGFEDEGLKWFRVSTLLSRRVRTDLRLSLWKINKYNNENFNLI